MAQFFSIHPGNPQPRLLNRAVQILQDGGIIAYPTDTCYALGCQLTAKSALDRLRKLRRLDANHNFTLVCRNLAEVSPYVKMSNQSYRLLRSGTPGPYTFILPATHEVPRRLQTARRKTIGIRIPDSTLVQQLLVSLGEPLNSTTLLLPGQSQPLNEPEHIRQQLEHEIDLVIDSGFCGIEPSTVIDLSDNTPRLLRQGKGAVEQLLGKFR